MLLIPLYSQHIFLVYPGAYPWGKLMRCVSCSMKIYEAVADPQEGPTPPPTPLFLDQSEAKRAVNNFLGDHPPRLI